MTRGLLAGLTIEALDADGEEVHIAITPSGIVAAASGIDSTTFEIALRRRFGVLPDPCPADLGRLEPLRPVILAVARGEDVDVRAVPIDIADRPAFDRAVLHAVRDVPWGSTASYGEIARRIGLPGAARAVGGAVGRNPLWMLVPCHRVIAADGTLGGYGGVGPFERADALELKRRLLLREGVTVGVATE